MGSIRFNVSRGPALVRTLRAVRLTLIEAPSFDARNSLLA
jgi:hypothetical protein